MEKSMPIAVVAVIISIVAVLSGVAAIFMKPTPTIGAGDVGTNELADDSVTGGKIQDGSITSADITDGTITADDIAAGVIPEVGGIADNSITSAKIQDGTITDVDIVASGISLIADDSVTGAKIVNGTITNADISGLLISNENISGLSITGDNIENGTITNADIAAGANIDPSKISGTAWTSTNDGSGSGLDADKLDNLSSGQFLRSDTSGTISGNLTVDGAVTTENVVYSSPHTHYFVVESEAFDPVNDNVEYVNNAQLEGAYVYGGSGALAASVHLPQGAVVTSFKVFFNDNSTNDVTVYLEKFNLATGGYGTMSQIDSSGISGYGSKTDTTISMATINNEQYGYDVYAYWFVGDSRVQVIGALITYTTNSAL